jgi:lipopolysaccharide export system protein LptA
MKRRAAAALVFALLSFPAVADAAAPAGLALDASQPISVNADSFVADLNSETGLYTGNVIVTQGKVRLHADRLKISAPGGKASRMEVDGHVVVDSPSGQVSGDSGVYDVAGQVLKLTGNVVLTKDDNVLRGTALEVSMATGVASLTAGRNSVSGGAPSGRVQGLFSPSQAANSPSANTGPANAGTPSNP